MEIRQILANALDERDELVSNKQISKDIGVCDTKLSRYFQGKFNLSFRDLLDLIRYLLPNEEKDLMRLLIVEYSEKAKPVYVRCLMLYLVNNHMFAELDELCSNIPKKNYENIAFAQIVFVFGRHKRREVMRYKLTNEIAMLHFDSPEFTTLKYLLLSYANLHSGDFNCFFDIVKEAEKSALLITNPYIRESLHTYVYEMLATAYLFQKADTTKARFYLSMLYKCKEICFNTEVNAAYTMGMSHLFEDFDKALERLNFCASRLRELGNDDRASLIENDDIPFLYSYWRKELPQSSDAMKNVIAYRKFVNGHVEDAKILAAELGSEDPFDVFVKGLVNNDESLLVAAMMKYRMKSNELFAGLPRMYIKNPDVKNAI